MPAGSDRSGDVVEMGGGGSHGTKPKPDGRFHSDKRPLNAESKKSKMIAGK